MKACLEIQETLQTVGVTRASQVVLVVKDLPANTGDARDTGSVPGWGRSPGEGNGNPLQYSCLETSMQRSLAGYSPWSRKQLDMTEHPS